MQSNTGFLDLLFNLLLGFTVLFFVSFLMIKPLVKKADAKNQAEYLISVTWPDDNRNDIDTWLEDPLGGLVWFRQKEFNMSHLDRDDLGHKNDSVVLPDGTVISCPVNQELTTIRGFIPGEWVLNTHLYKKNESKSTTVKISIDKINPRFKTVFFKELVFNTQWQEETVTRFEMLSSGEIISFDPTKKDLVKTEFRVPTSSGGTGIVALLLWFIVYAKGYFIFKVCITGVVIWFAIPVYYLIPNLAGWPTGQEMQDGSRVMAIRIVEPKGSDPGAFYFWCNILPDLESDVINLLDPAKLFAYTGSAKPRAYQLPYDREMHKRILEAQKEKKKAGGSFMVVSRGKKKPDGKGQQDKVGFKIINPIEILTKDE
jgi:hypothetical protein